jgi:ubiquinone biosynthesis protein COQ9
MVDEMWHVAGDVSVDSQWYTKRLLIGGVYTSTELFLITDSSEGHKDTWAYLDRCVRVCVYVCACACVASMTHHIHTQT